MNKNKNEIGIGDIVTLNIDEIVGDIQQDKNNKDGKSLMSVAKETMPVEENADYSHSVDEGDLWNCFLKCCGGYEYRVKKEGRKSYWIDGDIAETFNRININKMSTTDIINAALRAFITTNKEGLRTFLDNQYVLI